ncbi:Hypothetical predicted protein [Octopus vulgaris]|uniref:Uncharacterized protein n=1 Tax=Octopus vulgaris TaxID=6645 RepID=A0AA36FKB3_OCTVU|nr:Hypothetical predicted protein [Octopus vulgaris]
MLAKRGAEQTDPQLDSKLDLSRDFHKPRYRPYKQNSSQAPKKTLEMAPIEPHQNENTSKKPSRRHVTKLSRGPSQNIPDERISPGKSEISRRERRQWNKRSNSLFSPHVTNLYPFETIDVSNSSNAGSLSNASSLSNDLPNGTAEARMSDNAALDRRKLHIQNRRRNGQKAVESSISSRGVYHLSSPRTSEKSYHSSKTSEFHSKRLQRERSNDLENNRSLYISSRNSTHSEALTDDYGMSLRDDDVDVLTKDDMKDKKAHYNNSDFKLESRGSDSYFNGYDKSYSSDMNSNNNNYYNDIDSDSDRYASTRLAHNSKDKRFELGNLHDASPLRSLMKWEYEDLYGGKRPNSVRPARPKSAVVSARTHAMTITDSDDSSLDGDIEYVDLEELSDGEDAIVLIDPESMKHQSNNSWKDDDSDVRRSVSTKASQEISPRQNPRFVNKISQESKRLRSNGSESGKPDTNWLFANKNSDSSKERREKRRESFMDPTDPSEFKLNGQIHKLNMKKDMFDLSSFKDNLSLPREASLTSSFQKYNRDRLLSDSLRQNNAVLKTQKHQSDRSDMIRFEKKELLPRRSSHPPLPRRLKPLFRNMPDDGEGNELNENGLA